MSENQTPKKKSTVSAILIVVSIAAAVGLLHALQQRTPDMEYAKYISPIFFRNGR